MMDQMRETLKFIKDTLENVAKASVKVITGNTYNVKVENPTEIKFPDTQKVTGNVNINNLPDNTNDFLELSRSIDNLVPILRKLDKDSVKLSNIKDIKFSLMKVYLYLQATNI